MYFIHLILSFEVLWCGDPTHPDGIISRKSRYKQVRSTVTNSNGTIAIRLQNTENPVKIRFLRSNEKRSHEPVAGITNRVHSNQ